MLRTLFLALSMLLSATLTFAQTTSATTATVTGTVTDQQGGVLPGVTASLSGPSMMGVQTQVSDEHGPLSLRLDSSWRIQARVRAGGFATSRARACG